MADEYLDYYEDEWDIIDHEWLFWEDKIAREEEDSKFGRLIVRDKKEENHE